MSLIEPNRGRSLLSIMYELFVEKKFKFQKINTIDDETAFFTMSVSYDEQDIMLYEITWEITPSSIKAYSFMTTRKQVPWTIRMSDHHHIVPLMITLNSGLAQGKLSYSVDSSHVTYEIGFFNMHSPFYKEDVKKLQEGIFRYACRFVLEMSNSFILFNSNPELSPKDITHLANKHTVREMLMANGNSEYKKMVKEVTKTTEFLAEDVMME